MPGNPLSWKQVVKEYFIFSKSQRRAVIILCTAILFFVFIPAVYHYFFNPVTEIDNSVIVETVSGLKPDFERPVSAKTSPGASSGYLSPLNTINKNESSEPLFDFDPNTASITDWQRLGLKDKTIQTIQNYLSKGGHFYKPGDLGKIYGLSSSYLSRLLPYIKIKASSKTANAALQGTAENEKSINISDKNLPAKQSPININTADTLAFKALSGIGSKLAVRIVNFRNKLGGFYSVEQVGETYGLPDSVFQKNKGLMFVKEVALRKININTATMEELRTPYIPYNVANAIIQYRLQHGLFRSPDDIRRIPAIDQTLFDKISPYLFVNQ